jgi:DNA-binding transcriptional LysR family regulator
MSLIGDGRGLVQAAKFVGLSQSAASHAVAVLERSTGALLFTRNAGHLRLSNTGERILPHVRQVLHSLDAISEELAAEEGVQTGSVRIAAIPSLASTVIPPLLREFSKRYPGIEVTLLEGTDQEVADWVRRKVSHCGFAALPIPATKSEAIGTDEWMILASSQQFTSKTQLKLESLVNHRLLVAGGGCEEHVHQLFREAQLDLPEHLLVCQVDTIHAMVAEGLGFSLLPSLTLTRRPRSTRVISLLPKLYRTIGLLLPSDPFPSIALERWVELVRGKFSDTLRRALAKVK